MMETISTILSGRDCRCRVPSQASGTSSVCAARSRRARPHRGLAMRLRRTASSTACFTRWHALRCGLASLATRRPSRRLRRAPPLAGSSLRLGAREPLRGAVGPLAPAPLLAGGGAPPRLRVSAVPPLGGALARFPLVAGSGGCVPRPPSGFRACERGCRVPHKPIQRKGTASRCKWHPCAVLSYAVRGKQARQSRTPAQGEVYTIQK